METNRSNIASWCIATLLCLSINAIPKTVGQENKDVQASIKKDGGVETVEFDTLVGKVEVNLPDDMSDTDTISGTVLVEPKGETKEEIAQAEDTLRGYVVEIEKTQEVAPPPEKPSPPVKQKPPTMKCPPAKPGGTAVRSGTCTGVPPIIYVVPGSRGGFTAAIPPKCGGVRVTVKNSGGTTICSLPVPTNKIPPKPPRGCVIPPTCNAGGPLRIPGPSDGCIWNTNVKVNGNTCPPICESPRGTICLAPTNVRGPCTVSVTECGQTKTGTTKMLPPKTSSPPAQQPSKPAGSAGKYVFRRTGPFVEQETPSCFVDQGNTVSITESSISWTGPKSIKGDPMVSSTFVFQPPPELIRVGDSFTLNASTSGDRYVSTQGMYHCDHSWIKPANQPQSVTLSPGYGSPSGSFSYTVVDYPKVLEDALKQHPEHADKVTPEVRNRMPSLFLFCPGRINVKIIWRYVREK